MKKFLIILFAMLLIPVFADNFEPEILPSVTGVVTSIVYDDIDNDEITQTKQIAEVKILDGNFKGNIVVLDNMLSGNPYYDIVLKKNTKVILHVETDGEEVNFSIENIKRSNSLVWLSIIFAGLLFYVGKIKGLYSLISIGLTLLMITHILTPMILMGINPLIGTILICLLSTGTTMYLVGGFNAKSTSALIGTILSLIVAGILSYITIFAAHLTGFSDETTMYLFAAHPELNFVEIAIATMILATLGAVMDVAMSIASTINEIYITDNTLSKKDLYYAGLNVGRDIIGTMANTLILVYLGGSLPLILLINNIDLQKFINLNQVVTEIASALIGSIAIVICVPITAIVASQMTKYFAQKHEKISLIATSTKL